MAKMFFIEKEQLAKLEELMARRVDNEYIVLQSNYQLADIAQYSAKYMNIHFACVPVNKLDSNLRLS